jgi:hypothetical protein
MIGKVGAIFLDRDGVINQNRVDHVKNWEEFEFVPGALESIRILTETGLPIFVVTNQAVVNRGLMNLDVLDDIHQRMLREIERAGGQAMPLTADVSDAAVRVFIGTISIAFVLYTWFIPRRLVEGAKTENIPAGAFWGAMSGFTSTICQAGGPPFQMYVLSQNLSKMAFVGTTAVFFCVLNWVKVIPYAALGQFSMQGFLTSLALMPLAFVASRVGFWLVRITPQERFFKIVTVLMLVLSIELTRQGAVQLWWP